jgi:hypothetical protein
LDRIMADSYSTKLRMLRVLRLSPPPPRELILSE